MDPHEIQSADTSGDDVDCSSSNSSHVMASDEVTKDSHPQSNNTSITLDQKNVIASESNPEEDGVVKLLDNEITKLSVTPADSERSAKESANEPENKRTKELSKSEAELHRLCQNMFLKLENFLEGEVASSVNDYALLESMNKVTTMRYQSVLKDAKTVVQGMHEVNTKFSDLRLYLEQIDHIEQEVVTLEQAAYKLDGYAKRLEEKFRKLEKR